MAATLTKPLTEAARWLTSTPVPTCQPRAGWKGHRGSSSPVGLVPGRQTGGHDPVWVLDPRKVRHPQAPVDDLDPDRARLKAVRHPPAITRQTQVCTGCSLRNVRCISLPAHVTAGLLPALSSAAACKQLPMEPAKCSEIHDNTVQWMEIQAHQQAINCSLIASSTRSCTAQHAMH